MHIVFFATVRVQIIRIMECIAKVKNTVGINMSMARLEAASENGCLYSKC